METTISQHWVKMLLFGHLNHFIYTDADWAAEGLEITKEELLKRLAVAAIVQEDYIYYGLLPDDAPESLEAPVDQQSFAKVMAGVGLQGLEYTSDQDYTGDPYVLHGFKKVMMGGGKHSVTHYMKPGGSVCYGSLPWHLYTERIIVNKSFYPYLLAKAIDTSGLMYPISEKKRGKNEVFDILYDLRFGDFIRNIAATSNLIQEENDNQHQCVSLSKGAIQGHLSTV